MISRFKEFGIWESQETVYRREVQKKSNLPFASPRVYGGSILASWGGINHPTRALGQIKDCAPRESEDAGLVIGGFDAQPLFVPGEGIPVSFVVNST